MIIIQTALEIMTVMYYSLDYDTLAMSGAGFNGRVNGFTRVDSARPVADQ